MAGTHATRRRPRWSTTSSSSSSPYAAAAHLLQQVLAERRPLKSLVYDARTHQLQVATVNYAQVTHVLQNISTLQTLRDQVLANVKVKNEALLLVLLYELLLGPHQSIRGGGALKRVLMEHESTLRDALTVHRENSVDADTKDATRTVRYIRVNTLKTTVAEVAQRLTWLPVSHYLDPDIPDLLVVPWQHTSGILGDDTLRDSVVLQDKASCLPAFCLVYGYDDAPQSLAAMPRRILDACAAPGNKTHHLACLMSQHDNAFSIDAVDRNHQRAQTLERRMQEMGVCSHVRIHHADFLRLRPVDDFDNVDAILLDPSCSGSGMPQHDNDVREERLRHLSNLQHTLLSHALSGMGPSVQRVVYSTCSVHEQENELVVTEALRQHVDWTLIAPSCLPGWSCRGRLVTGLTAEQAACLVRVPLHDMTGFFVACFARRRISLQSSSGTSLRENNIVEERIRQQSQALKVELYRGQFAQGEMTTTCGLVNSEMMANDTTVKTTASPTKGRATSEERVVPKKVSKKLQWKQRQKEAKMKRLQSKNLR